jgi:membrane protease YdiL (CAAX protease family)
VPIELLILKYYANKEAKKISDLILYKDKTPIKIFSTSIIILFIFAAIVMSFLPEYEQHFLKIFDFIPDWFREEKNKISDIKYLELTIVFGLLFDGIIVPIVEEVYFRGFLLPRMQIFGKAAPLINIILFSVYHFFTPWKNISRIIAMLPEVYWIWHKKDIKIGIIVHCLGNIIGWVLITVEMFILK